MQKQKIIVIALAIISTTILLGSSNLYATETTTPPLNTTTLEYKDYEYYLFNSPQEVNLTLIHAETTTNALTITKTDYYPSTNETKYKFSSNEITIPPDFNPGIKKYTVQNTATGQLYYIKIDFGQVLVPLSQLEKDYQHLQENHTQLLETYNTTNKTKKQLQENITSIQNTLSQEYNLTENSITTLTETLLNTYLETKQELNLTEQQIENLKITLETKNETIQHTNQDYQILLSNYSNLLAKYHQINETLNETTTNLMNKSMQLSKLQRFKQDIDYGTGSFTYDGRLYRSQQSYQNEIQKLEDDIGMTPSYIILAVIITFLGVYYFSKNYYEKAQPTPQELQEYGYSPKAQSYDNFIIRTIMEKAGEITGRFKKQKQSQPQQPTYENTTTEQKTKNTGVEEKIDTLIKQQTNQTDTVNHYMKKTDQRIDTIENNVDHIRESIDNLKPTKQKNNKGKNKK